MRLLLDTHTILWSITNTSKLPSKVVAAITDMANEVFVSSVSFWEIAIKFNLKKLELPNINPLQIPVLCKTMGFEYFDISPIDAITSFQLPHKLNHKDPFDRMLIHLAIRNSYTLISSDSQARFYEADGLKYLW